MAQIGCGLSWLMTQHHHVGINQSKGINNNLEKTVATQQLQTLTLESTLDQYLLFSGQSLIFTFPLTL